MEESWSSESLEYVSSAKFTWKIASFSWRIMSHSNWFNAGGHKWRIQVNPIWKEPNYLSVYLEVDDSETSCDGWSIDAKLRISVISEVEKHTIKKEGKRTFSAKMRGWGYSSIMTLNELYDPSRGYLVDDICTVQVKVSFPEDQVKEFLGDEKTDTGTEKNSSHSSEFDALFTNIQNLLDSTLSSKKNSNNFSTHEIAEAKKIFKQCLNMDITSVIYSGKPPEFKHSLSILLTSNAFPVNEVDRTSEIMANFVENCKQYQIARQDLSESQENENLVSDLMAVLKRLSTKDITIRKQAVAIDQEIAMLEKQVTARNTKKVKLKKKLDDLAVQAAASEEALLYAEQKWKSSMMNREQAERMIDDFERSWEFLKDLPTS